MTPTRRMTPTSPVGRLAARSRRRLATLALLVVAAAVAVAAAGCGIPTQGTPSALARSKVPFNLLDPHPPTTTTTQPKPSSYVPVKVFFLGQNNQLESVQRYVAAPAPLDAVIDAMLAGPTSTETSQGLTTAIPSDVAVLSVTSSSPSNNVVTVNMNTAFGQITGINSELAVAQIVATVATEAGLNTGVIFEIDGQRTSVPIANGQQVSGPVYLIEFLDVGP
ncbi:MAG TPA: GerMN domain-containing protein [Acidimicrobiales bacterium]|nr:GerMN domain-containing protein [Acidimicrobiales bacterium]